ncbi:hypothetical protein EG327_001903, partial [Venturia inaequalis]
QFFQPKAAWHGNQPVSQYPRIQNSKPTLTGSQGTNVFEASSSGIFGDTVLQERRVISDIQVGCNESTFARQHLATDASVFFRSDGRYPRSFLWRLLDDRRALEIQSVDLSEDVKERTEALLTTLILHFSAAIRPFCIGFADSDDTDAIDIFAITTTNELWTLTLLKDYFVRLKSTEDMPPGWCKSSQPSLTSLADSRCGQAILVRTTLVAAPSITIFEMPATFRDEYWSSSKT